MYTIENEALKVSVKTKGAELSEIFSKQTGLEYLWNGDARFWGKQSPVLFPIVGTLKNNTYIFGGTEYHLGRHGFARDRDFVCTSQENDSITMSLLSDPKTLLVYPFHFRLDIIYSLHSNRLRVKYRVVNTGASDMFFSLGAHPAFRLPLEKHLEYDDYFLEFENVENAMRWQISRDGLIEPIPVPFLTNEKELGLDKKLFLKDAIVFKHLNSNVISIRSHKSSHGIEFHFERFPFFGIWAAPEADFVCLEPWCGIADNTASTQQFEKKEGINLLTAGQDFHRSWEVVVT